MAVVGPLPSAAVDWDLPDELAPLQASVRRLAQDKVKPRAREIDDTGAYPEDLFALFGQPACSAWACRRSTAAAGRASSA